MSEDIAPHLAKGGGVSKECWMTGVFPFLDTIFMGAIAVDLTPDDLREIESAASKIKIEGTRYPENLERMTGR